MKRSTILLASGLAMASGAALAGINVTDPGLPASWTVTTGVGYATETVTKNAASGMCVECHTVNPSQHIWTPSDVKSLGIATNYRQDRVWGSHAVLNSLTNSTFKGQTNSGGGFIGGVNAAGGAAATGGRDGGQYFKGTTTTWASGGLSKFNNGTTGVLNSINEGATGFDVAVADLICESCHNLVTNMGGNLLLDDYTDNGTDTLCVKCHTAGTNTYASFHTNDNLLAFSGTARKRHHVLTGDLLNFYGLTGSSSTGWAPVLSTPVAAGWCATPYSTQGTATDILGATVDFRGACSVSGTGARLIANLTGDIQAVARTDIKCTNCHRPHNAMSGGGAFILRTGKTIAAADNFPGVTANSLAVTSIGYGIRRQSDVGNYTSKVYGEYQNLCVGCHTGYGN